jgi:hypothetical protein
VAPLTTPSASRARPRKVREEEGRVFMVGFSREVDDRRFAVS